MPLGKKWEKTIPLRLPSTLTLGSTTTVLLQGMDSGGASARWKRWQCLTRCNFVGLRSKHRKKELTYYNKDSSQWWTQIEFYGKTKAGEVVNGLEVLWSQRAKFAKWKFLQQYTVSVKLLPLRRDACKCHCPCGAHIFTQQEGAAFGSGSDLGGDDLSVSPLGLLTHAFVFFLFLFLAFLSIWNTLLLPLSSLSKCFTFAHSSLFYFLPTLPFFVLVTMATAFSERGGEAGGLMAETGACVTPAIHHCPSFSPLKSLSLSSLQLTAVKRKSCWNGARYMPSNSFVSPIIVYIESKTKKRVKDSEKTRWRFLLVLIQDFPVSGSFRVLLHTLIGSKPLISAHNKQGNTRWS